MTDMLSDPTPDRFWSRPFGKVLAGMLLPLLFATVFPLAFVTAMHAPQPHDAQIVIVGPDAVVSQLAGRLDRTSEFTVTHTDVASETTDALTQRRADGVIQVTPGSAEPATAAGAAAGPVAPAPAYTVTTYVAGANGRTLATAVTALGRQVATAYGAPAPAVKDVVPLFAQDASGTNLLLLLTYTSLAAYLTVVVMSKIWAGARLRTRLLAAALAAVIAPLIAFGLSAIFAGDYGASFQTILALLAANSLVVFTTAVAAILIDQLFGEAILVGVMVFLVFLNFPSSGGGSPVAMLPPFWQFVHNMYFGSAGLELFRSIVYFGGNGIGRWIGQLVIWSVTLLLLTLLLELNQLVGRQRQRIAELTALPSPGSPQSAAHRRTIIVQPLVAAAGAQYSPMTHKEQTR